MSYISYTLVTVMSILYLSTIVQSGDDTHHHHLGLFRKLHAQIQEKLCSGKATNAQLTELTNCSIEFRSQFHLIDAKTKEIIDKTVSECLKKHESDIGFEVEESHRETVFMACSDKFKHCLRDQVLKIPSVAIGAFTTTGSSEEATPNTTESTDSTQSTATPIEGESRILKLIECKQKALQL